MRTAIHRIRSTLHDHRRRRDRLMLHADATAIVIQRRITRIIERASRQDARDDVRRIMDVLGALIAT